METYLNQQAREGKDEIEAYRNLMEVLGIEYPLNGESMNEMTDKQFDIIFQMFEMILDGCKDLDDAKRKVKELLVSLD